MLDAQLISGAGRALLFFPEKPTVQTFTSLCGQKEEVLLSEKNHSFS